MRWDGLGWAGVGWGGVGSVGTGWGRVGRGGVEWGRGWLVLRGVGRCGCSLNCACLLIVSID